MDLSSLLLVALLGQSAAPAAAANDAVQPSPPRAATKTGNENKRPAAATNTTTDAPETQPAPEEHGPARLDGIHDEEPAGDAAAETHAAPAADALAPVHTAQPPPGVADTLLEWLASDHQVALEGKPTPLVDLLARVTDRGQQTLIVQTYWKLSAALAEYRIAADESTRLGQLLPPADATGKHPTDPLLESRLASSEARLREAEVAVVGLQYALSEIVRSPAADPPVLPADLPHAGAYRTYFQDRYMRVAPPRGHLIDRSLPLLHRSLELRAMAAVAAADAADADQEAYHAGKLDAFAVMESLAELTRQRRAFVAAVRDYNVDIAEYAFSVVPPGLSSAQLVGVLIGPAQPAGSGSAGQKAIVQDPPVKRAGFDQPIDTGVGQSAAPGLLRQGPGSNVDDARPLNRNTSGPTPRGSSARPPKRIKSYVPKSSAKNPAQNPVGKEGRTAWVAAKPPLDDADQPSAAEAASSDAGLYSAFAALEPPQRLRQLADTLQWDRASDLTGTAITLADALAAAVDRRAAIAAYWQGRERIAAYQIRQQQHEQLLALQSAALRLRDQPNAAEAVLRWQTARLAAEAGAVETQVAILAAQFDLAVAMRRPLSGTWPLPITPPHAGHFRLKVETQPAAVVQAPPVRRLARGIPTLYEALLRRAEAVVATDAARAEITARCESGEALLDQAIAVISQAAEEALSLLADQSEYNLQFAEYVLAVAPPALAAQELAGLLVVAPSPAGGKM